MSKELIVRLREAAAQRVASTAMIGADDLSAAADALESLGAAYGGAVEAGRALRALREQEPIGYISPKTSHWLAAHKASPSSYGAIRIHCSETDSQTVPLYAHPVPARYITNDAIEEMAEDFLSTDGDEAPLVVGYVEFARAIEAALMGEGG